MKGRQQIIHDNNHHCVFTCCLCYSEIPFRFRNNPEHVTDMLPCWGKEQEHTHHLVQDLNHQYLLLDGTSDFFFLFNQNGSFLTCNSLQKLPDTENPPKFQGQNKHFFPQFHLGSDDYTPVFCCCRCVITTGLLLGGKGVTPMLIPLCANSVQGVAPTNVHRYFFCVMSFLIDSY